MRSILQTRPKGAPGRDKPVPYGAVGNDASPLCAHVRHGIPHLS